MTLKKVVQLLTLKIKFKAGDQDSMIKGIKEKAEVALDKEGVELLSIGLSELKIWFKRKVKDVPVYLKEDFPDRGIHEARI